MPIAATKSNECLIAANKILNKYLAGETLSPFDSYSYEKLANDLKKVRPSDSLQLRGLIAMINDDDKASMTSSHVHCLPLRIFHWPELILLQH